LGTRAATCCAMKFDGTNYLHSRRDSRARARHLPLLGQRTGIAGFPAAFAARQRGQHDTAMFDEPVWIGKSSRSKSIYNTNLHSGRAPPARAEQESRNHEY